MSYRKRYQGWYRTQPRHLPVLPPLPRNLKGHPFRVNVEPMLPPEWTLADLNYTGRIGLCTTYRRQWLPPYEPILELRLPLPTGEALHWPFILSHLTPVERFPASRIRLIAFDQPPYSLSLPNEHPLLWQGGVGIQLPEIASTIYAFRPARIENPDVPQLARLWDDTIIFERAYQLSTNPALDYQLLEPVMIEYDFDPSTFFSIQSLIQHHIDEVELPYSPTSGISADNSITLLRHINLHLYSRHQCRELPTLVSYLRYYGLTWSPDTLY